MHIVDEGTSSGLNSKFMYGFDLENHLKVREKSVKSQGIFLKWTAGNLVNVNTGKFAPFVVSEYELCSK